MESKITIEDLQKAWEAKDPQLSNLIVELVRSADPVIEPPPREGALSYDRYIEALRSFEFQKKTPEEKKNYRISQMDLLEAEDAEVPLPDRLKVYKVLLQLWEEGGVYERSCLLRTIQDIPLKWGPWRALKRIFKEAEEKNDTEVFGALAARFDTELASYRDGGEISKVTLTYLCRRAWRFLRRKAEQFPACYPDAASDVLKFYPSDTSFVRSWVANHIFFHHLKNYRGKKIYNRNRFKHGWRIPNDMLKDRAYSDLWKRSPIPLFSLLENAKSDEVRNFAVASLKKDFVAALDSVDFFWVKRLLEVRSKVVDEFIVWLLINIPKFDQSSFKEAGIHEAILGLFHSGSTSARKYAADYARAYARDLPVETLILLVDNHDKVISKLALDLFGDRDARKDIGLDGWGKLLETQKGSKLASDMLKKHFGASELTKKWFQERLLSTRSFRFASSNLLDVHSLKSLTPKFFYELFEQENISNVVADFALTKLGDFAPDKLDVEFIKQVLVIPDHLGRYYAINWIEEGKIKPEKIGTDFLKMVAFHTDFEKSEWIEKLKKKNLPWSKEVKYDEGLAEYCFKWLSDVRIFKPSEVGFEWLMDLVKRSEPIYHTFAVDYMTKAFSPADFAKMSKKKAPAKKAKPKKEEKVDFKLQTFLFTGKLKTMTRSEAKDKVKNNNGKSASGVNKNLDYLVIGDEGSPLYGGGRKGSKQVKAEKLAAEGAGIKIISETAFLQMITGKQETFSEDQIGEGCENLWNMLLDEDEKKLSLSLFATEYFKKHHTKIAVELTDRHVDPGNEIPETFMTFERFSPLFLDKRERIRKLALEFARWELGRWNPSIEKLMPFIESPQEEISSFFSKAILAEDTKENRFFRVSSQQVTPDAVYRLCDSLEAPARMLGMKLIKRDSNLAVPEELFRLTENPDRNVLSFVITSLWDLYRDKGVTFGWKAPVKDEKEKGYVCVKQEKLPAEHESLKDFFRRILFRIPPAKFSKDTPRDDQLGYIPARKVKLRLVEVFRDIALKNEAFAELVTPLLKEFMDSEGKSEKAACMVALVRIGNTYPKLNIWNEGK